MDLYENQDCVFIEGVSNDSQKDAKTLNLKKRLISQVRKHRILYDSRHKLFSNVAEKEKVWQRIAKNLKSRVNDCKDAWFELRYCYQRHARSLRNYFIHGRKKNLKRPVMGLESELIFLWRLIDNRKTFKMPFEMVDNEKAKIVIEDSSGEVYAFENSADDDIEMESNSDDGLIMTESITSDEVNDDIETENQFQLTSLMKALIGEIKNYRELYDCQHVDFKNYSRKSYIWNVIASNLGFKATKLMKIWFLLQTRYEWEICQVDQTCDNKAAVSQLQDQFEFLKYCMLENPETVYKQSYYLKKSWFNPIESFKDLYRFIHCMKMMPEIVSITASLLKTPGKSKEYLSLWAELASLQNCSPGQCETTWLIMHNFHSELVQMRQKNYQLADKWYFESLISKLYAISNTEQMSKQKENEHLGPTTKAIKRSAATSAVFQETPTNKLLSLPSKAPRLSKDVIQSSLSDITADIDMTTQTSNSASLQIESIPDVRTSTLIMQPEDGIAALGLPTQTWNSELLQIALDPSFPTSTLIMQPVDGTGAISLLSQTWNTDSLQIKRDLGWILPISTLIMQPQQIEQNPGLSTLTPITQVIKEIPALLPQKTAVNKLPTQTSNSGSLPVKRNTGLPTLAPITQALKETPAPLPQKTAAIKLPTQATNYGPLPVKRNTGLPTLAPIVQALKETPAAIKLPTQTASSGSIPIKRRTGLPTLVPITQTKKGTTAPLPQKTQAIKETPEPLPQTTAANKMSTQTANSGILLIKRNIELPALMRITQAINETLEPLPQKTAGNKMSTHTSSPGSLQIKPIPSLSNSTKTLPIEMPIPYNLPSQTKLRLITPSCKLTFPPSFSSQSSNTPHLSGSTTNATATTPAFTATENIQLLKMIGAISSLSSNEVLIELVSSEQGNQLVVYGSSLIAQYQLSMPTVTKLIREILSIPLLHSKKQVDPNLTAFYWEHISNKFNLPAHICHCCWIFLLENFKNFPEIASFDELMKPFETSLQVWRESLSLFAEFDALCVSKNWLQYANILPNVVECISGFPILYESSTKHGKQLCTMKRLCAWRTIKLRFPNIPEIEEIWTALKSHFIVYMVALESGIVNKWSMNWWRSLAKLIFLVEDRYPKNDALYYTISNKMLEEIAKCAAAEMKKRRATEAVNNKINIELINDTSKSNDMHSVGLIDSTRKSSDTASVMDSDIEIKTESDQNLNIELVSSARKSNDVITMMDSDVEIKNEIDENLNVGLINSTRKSTDSHSKNGNKVNGNIKNNNIDSYKENRNETSENLNTELLNNAENSDDIESMINSYTIRTTKVNLNIDKTNNLMEKSKFTHSDVEIRNKINAIIDSLINKVESNDTVIDSPLSSGSEVNENFNNEVLNNNWDETSDAVKVMGPHAESRKEINKNVIIGLKNNMEKSNAIAPVVVSHKVNENEINQNLNNESIYKMENNNDIVSAMDSCDESLNEMVNNMKNSNDTISLIELQAGDANKPGEELNIELENNMEDNNDAASMTDSDTESTDEVNEISNVELENNAKKISDTITVIESQAGDANKVSQESNMELTNNMEDSIETASMIDWDIGIGVENNQNLNMELEYRLKKVADKLSMIDSNIENRNNVENKNDIVSTMDSHNESINEINNMEKSNDAISLIELQAGIVNKAGEELNIELENNMEDNNDAASMTDSDTESTDEVNENSNVELENNAKKISDTMTAIESQAGSTNKASEESNIELVNDMEHSNDMVSPIDLHQETENEINETLNMQLVENMEKTDTTTVIASHTGSKDENALNVAMVKNTNERNDRQSVMDIRSGYEINESSNIESMNNTDESSGTASVIDSISKSGSEVNANLSTDTVNNMRRSTNTPITMDSESENETIESISEHSGSKTVERNNLASVSNIKSNQVAEFGTLIAIIQKYPAILGKASNIAKHEAWKKVAEELQVEVLDCLFAFGYDIENYFVYKKFHDSGKFCINEKYYKTFAEIVDNLPYKKFSTSCGKESELNQTVENDDSELVFPSRYISDINMSNCPSDLVVKNWIFALSNIRQFSHASHLKLKKILRKYLSNDN